MPDNKLINEALTAIKTIGDSKQSVSEVVKAVSDPSYGGGIIEKERIKHKIERKLHRNFGKTFADATKKQIYKAVAMTLRDQISDLWKQNEEDKEKTLYYLSFEFLIGRSLESNLCNLHLYELYKDVLADLGISLEEIAENEADAGLGNGGLGRLAACFMDSLASLKLPAYGCGIRYEYGLFKQKIVDGYQIEMPDTWLEGGNMWEIEKAEEEVEVHFGGTLEKYWEDDKLKVYVKDSSTVLAVPYDMPVVGYDGKKINTLRLWSARSPKHLDMNLFSSGDYAKALEERDVAELLSKVLYPEDNHFEGKNLRLRQQYFFTSATIQWIVRSLKKRGINLADMPKYAQIHINDTHPAIAIPELMRVLMDDEGLSWENAEKVVKQVFAYTNHTVMSEALEKWPIEMFQKLLPRVFEILEALHHNNEETLKNKFGDDWGKINYMNIMCDGYISMANLCLAHCHAVNGVSGLHTKILKKDIFKDYYTLYPNKFKNVTNGITFRRWLNLANPKLTNLIKDSIGDGFLQDATQLKEIEKFATDPAFATRFSQIKKDNKIALSNYLMREEGIMLDPNTIYDVQIKRLHEYKRQLLNLLHIIHLCNKLQENPNMEFYPQTFIFSAKASPGYKRAKLIIKLINSVAEKVNNDPVISKKIKVIFIENYGVTKAQKIIPATDISEQISTSGKEASGTGNMKFMLNGALTIGTLDGANVEMREILGDKNIYIFGLKADEVAKIYQDGNADSKKIYTSNIHLRNVLDNLINGWVEPEHQELFAEIYQSLVFGDSNFPDPYMILRDFDAYCHTHEKMWKDYLKQEQWNEKAIINVARSGHFSSDRCIDDYNKLVWKL